MSQHSWVMMMWPWRKTFVLFFGVTTWLHWCHWKNLGMIFWSHCWTLHLRDDREEIYIRGSEILVYFRQTIWWRSGVKLEDTSATESICMCFNRWTWTYWEQIHWGCGCVSIYPSSLEILLWTTSCMNKEVLHVNIINRSLSENQMLLNLQQNSFNRLLQMEGNWFLLPSPTWRRLVLRWRLWFALLCPLVSI